MPAAPICRAELEGQLSCQANRVCECVFSLAIPARRLPDRWRWDCGVNRGFCRMEPADSLAGFDPLNYMDFVVFDDAGRARDAVISGRPQSQRTPVPRQP